MESYRFLSSSAAVAVFRPTGCVLDEQYYRDVPRPEDCSPIETGAVLDFTIEGAPAEAAGSVVAFLVDADVESASLTGFDVLDRAAAEREVKQAALAEAMSTAEALAAQAGVVVERPSSIRYGDERRLGVASVGMFDALPAFQASAPAITPSVDLDLTPTPVRFDAAVAVTLEIAEDATEAP